jgi:NitT/TauT family transport system ATP-binding protein
MKGVSKSFSESGPVVLQEINLEVAQGDFLCILGASGCGKSTLLSMLAGLESPTTGEIQTASKPALMFQEPALYPWLTASRNVELVMQLRGVDKETRRAKAAELLGLVHLENAMNLRPHELSGGMRQRVALARALAQEGSVLLMDEPFAALDAVTRDILHEELIRVWKETSSTIVFVTHNVREAVRLGQKVLLMSSRPGRIIKEWEVNIAEPRRIEDEAVSKLAGTITHELRSEISRHAKQ